MIIKEREIPLRVLKLEALARRLPDSHPKMPNILRELANRKAGYRGESSLDYHLSFLQNKEYLILHGLRIQNQQGYFFQMDTLVLSPNFISIIEVKNYRGTITFDNHFNQLIQTVEESRRALEDPTLQVKRQLYQLKEWLKKHKFNLIPIHPLVIISNPSTIIESTSHPSYFKHISHSINLPAKFHELEKMSRKEYIQKRELKKLARMLMKNHSPQEYDVLKHFNLKPNDLRKGVQCPHCLSIPMKRKNGKWLCQECKERSRNAHVFALKDYSLLVGQTITNKKLRDFLLLASEDSARYILQSMNLPHTGKTKGRAYILPSHSKDAKK
ncbi:MAG TPA: nuclease-related domain-containing protein [Bacillaceae bacterium]